MLLYLFQVRHRNLPWRFFIGSGLVAAVAVWLLVSSNTSGSTETAVAAAVACAAWTLPLFSIFEREAKPSPTILKGNAKRLAWLAAGIAFVFAFLIIPGVSGEMGLWYWGIAAATAVAMGLAAMLAVRLYRETIDSGASAA
jgi:hypothetical protein